MIPVMKKRSRIFLFTLIALVAYSAVVALYTFKDPQYFLKAVTIVDASSISATDTISDADTGPADITEPLDITEVISNIPYKGGIIYTVDPEEKYIKTLQQGHGNCSNLSYGLAYLYSRQGQDYNLIHYFNTDTGFLKNGHVTVESSYTIDDNAKYGIIDVLEGGVVLDGKKPVSHEDLKHGIADSLKIYSMSSERDDKSYYYTPEFINHAVIGIMKSDEVRDYFNFLSAVYIRLGNAKLEKYFYDAVAIYFGFYPNIYMDTGDIDKLFAEHELLRPLSLLQLFAIRLIPVFVVLYILSKIFRKFEKS